MAEGVASLATLGGLLLMFVMMIAIIVDAIGAAASGADFLIKDRWIAIGSIVVSVLFGTAIFCRHVL